MRTPQQKYSDALDKIYELQEAVEKLTSQIEELQSDAENELEGELDEWEELDVVVFLRDIGFDPDRLPESLGERIAIRDAIQAARVLR